MNTVLERDQSVVLHNISWNSYQTISDTLQDETPAHFTYDNGRLEIMVLSLKHENLKKLLATLFERLAENLEVEIFAAGSTTFRRKDLDRGFEPDECYYIKHAEIMRGKESVNLDFDPPPDITIEIDVSHSSINRMKIFALMGITEVWRYDGEEVNFFCLSGKEYDKSSESNILTGVRAEKITELLEGGRSISQKDFLNTIEVYSKTLKDD
ncbi:MAG: Uma2 family endonuclease [Pyrinomonadaceae bacterium]